MSSTAPAMRWKTSLFRLATLSAVPCGHNVFTWTGKHRSPQLRRTRLSDDFRMNDQRHHRHILSIEDPLLGDLNDNNGPDADDRAPFPASPAIDAGIAGGPHHRPGGLARSVVAAEPYSAPSRSATNIWPSPATRVNLDAPSPVSRAPDRRNAHDQRHRLQRRRHLPTRTRRPGGRHRFTSPGSTRLFVTLARRRASTAATWSSPSTTPVHRPDGPCRVPVL